MKLDCKIENAVFRISFISLKVILVSLAAGEASNDAVPKRMELQPTSIKIDFVYPLSPTIFESALIS